MLTARKSIKQSFRPGAQVLSLMETFRQMTNDCIRIGIEIEKERGGKQTPSMKELSLRSYGELRTRYRCYSKYTLCAISKAAGMLASRRKSMKRGFHPRTPYISKPFLVSCYDLRIEHGNLMVRLDAGKFETIPLNPHTRSFLSDSALKVRAFTLSEESISLSVSKEVIAIGEEGLTGTVGVDRNLRNLTVGNAQAVTYYDMTKAVSIGDNTRGIIRSFTRSDARVRSKIISKYGKRKSDRTRQLLNLISKRVVREAKAKRQAIVFEEITGIGKLYKRGNGQGASFRGRMNSWPYHEIKRQIEYKAAWEGVPIITLTRGETRGTTMDCPRCGERLQVPIRGNNQHNRQLWCRTCGRWTDRDLVAVLNISRRGRLRFDRSLGREGEAREAVKGNAEHDGEPLILRVDASKLGRE